jgi:hypothetical protein
MKVVKRMLQFVHSAIYNADHFRLTFSLALIDEDVKSLSYQYTSFYGELRSGSVRWDKCSLIYPGSEYERRPYPLPICHVVKGTLSLHVILEDGSYRLVDPSLRESYHTWYNQVIEAYKLQAELNPHHLKLARLEAEIVRLRVMMGV